MAITPNSSHREGPEPFGAERQSRLRLVCSLVISASLLSFLLASCRSPQSNDPISIVQTAYERLNEGDVDGYMEFVSDDAVVLDGTGRFEGTEAIRAHLELSVGPGRHRLEISDLNLDGNVVYYTYEVYANDRFEARDMGAVVVVDGRIIFDGSATRMSIECFHDPSQAFCPGG